MTIAIDYASALNEEQRNAVLAPEGPMLVLAAAGTGKTRTLVYRVAHLVGQGVPSGRILLLTFTNRAAREMLERAESLVGGGIGELWGGTFHHMANRILRRHAEVLGYTRDYSILDRDDSRTLIRQCLEDLNLAQREFPKPDVLLAASGAAANTIRPLEDVIADRLGHTPVDLADVRRVLDAYARAKRRLGALDFDDLLARGLDLLEGHPEVLELYRQRFLHVLVDEYQDTNAVQARLVDHLAAARRNVFVVGDDFQCIYSWRGASFENIMTFTDRYRDARTFRLETNYRSVPEILAVANACIAGNPRQFQKTLRPTRPPHRRPVFARVRDGEHQALYVAEQIRRLLAAGLRGSEIAVLYRAHYHAMEVQLALARARLPYVITSGVRFFEQAHIKDVCSLLRVLQNPQDGVSFERLLRLFPRIGAQTARRLWERLGGRFEARDPDARAALREALPAGAREAWTRIEPLLKAYADEALQEDPGEAIHRFTEAFYADHAVNSFEDAERRLEDIRELVLYTARFESADEFLSDVALMTNLDSEVGVEAKEGLEAVRLSTVHQAKGLEWKAVIILWAVDGMFPSSRSLGESLEGEEEERRLFYVAVTRAKDELFLCAPEIRRTAEGGAMPCLPSRFVDEIPPRLLREARVGR